MKRPIKIIKGNRSNVETASRANTEAMPFNVSTIRKAWLAEIEQKRDIRRSLDIQAFFGIKAEAV